MWCKEKTINEGELTKGQVRKLNALRKSIGDELGEQAFAKWLRQRKTASKEDRPDPVAEMLAEALRPLAKKAPNHGRYGFSVKRAKGKDGRGIVVARIEKD